MDRADRRDVEELAERLALPRITGDDDDGDVGELMTAAMGSTEADLIVVIPADYVVLPDTVEVTAAAVAQPTAVRYAFTSNPDKANLYNKAGLPAVPFASDVWTPQGAPGEAPTSQAASAAPSSHKETNP